MAPSYFELKFKYIDHTLFPVNHNSFGFKKKFKLYQFQSE